MHPNETFIRNGYQAFNRGDVTAVMEMLDDSIAFVVPGKSLQSGRFSGKDEVRRYFSILKKHTSGTHRLEVEDVVAKDDRVVVVTRALGERDAARFDMTVVHIWRLDGGKLTELLLLPTDQYAFDEFWS